MPSWHILKLTRVKQGREVPVLPTRLLLWEACNGQCFGCFALWCWVIFLHTMSCEWMSNQNTPTSIWVWHSLCTFLRLMDRGYTLVCHPLFWIHTTVWNGSCLYSWNHNDCSWRAMQIIEKHTYVKRKCIFFPFNNVVDYVAKQALYFRLMIKVYKKAKVVAFSLCIL